MPEVEQGKWDSREPWWQVVVRFWPQTSICDTHASVTRVPDIGQERPFTADRDLHVLTCPRLSTSDMSLEKLHLASSRKSAQRLQFWFQSGIFVQFFVVMCMISTEFPQNKTKQTFNSEATAFSLGFFRFVHLSSRRSKEKSFSASTICPPTHRLLLLRTKPFSDNGPGVKCWYHWVLPFAPFLLWYKWMDVGHKFPWQVRWSWILTATQSNESYL